MSDPIANETAMAVTPTATLRASVRPSGTSPQRATTSELNARAIVTATKVVGTRHVDRVSTTVLTTTAAPNANTRADAIVAANGDGWGSATAIPCSSSEWAA